MGSRLRSNAASFPFLCPQRAISPAGIELSAGMKDNTLSMHSGEINPTLMEAVSSEFLVIDLFPENADSAYL